MAKTKTTTKTKLATKEVAKPTTLKQKIEEMIPSLEDVAPNQMSESTAAAVSKNFRSHPDMENFYRFIHEHDLRIEALQIINDVLLSRQNKKKKPSAVATLN